MAGAVRVRGSWSLALALGLLVALAPAMVPTVAAGSPANAPSGVAVTGLARGDRGDAVRTVQQALVDHGIAVAGGVDGVFGAGTEAAVKSFQQAQGLSASGAVDTATALALGLVSSPLLGLAVGARGDAVVTLQRKLVASGLTVPGGADGVFGQATKAALASFQQQKGLAASGQVDAATAGALEAVSAPDATAGDGPAGDVPSAPTPPATTSGSPLVGLKIGSRGDAVVQLQGLLIGAGFDVVGGADGIFGVLTANALSSFQNSKGLTANALADAATVDALTAAAATPPAPTASSAPPLAGLAYGATGDAVKQLQQALAAAGIRVPGGADGVFGTATIGAVKRFQAAKGLSQTGAVDEATAAALSGGGAVQSVAKPNVLLGLKYGSLGSAVKQLQESLIAAGLTLRGGADGIFGPATIAVLKKFQESQGLGATGVVDEGTIAALANPKAPVSSGNSGAGDGFAAYGEKGTRVRALQSALVGAGITPRGGIDGDFGAGTTAAVLEFQRRKGLPVTGKVDAATAAALGLAAAPKPAAPDPSAAKMSVFPVQRECKYIDTFGYGRGAGRVHLGVDILAARGSEVYAVADGRLTKVYDDYPGALTGNGVRLEAADGTYYFYAHLDSRATGIGLGTAVTAGQVLGYVGSTGNTILPHLHFEVHPNGGAAVNPYPLVKAIDACAG